MKEPNRVVDVNGEVWTAAQGAYYRLVSVDSGKVGYVAVLAPRKESDDRIEFDELVKSWDLLTDSIKDITDIVQCPHAQGGICFRRGVPVNEEEEESEGTDAEAL